VHPERGTVVVRGSLSGPSPGGADVVLEMPGVLADAVSWASDDCVTETSGRVSCSTGNGAARARFAPHGGAQLFRLVVATPALVPRSGADVTVVLAYGGARQVGSIPASGCRARNLGLRCRQR